MTLHQQAARRRFERAVNAVGGTDDTDAVFDDLVARYGEPHRHYHTLTHVHACLRWFDRLSHLAEHRAEVELALWFHDAIYDPRAPDNERRSAELAAQALTEFGALPESVARVVQHIEATERHTATRRDSTLVVDVDLAILAAPAADFDRFEAQIQAEYAHVPVALFRAGRCQVLRGFLTRPSIYRVSEVRDLLELPARRNLERRILELVADE